MTIAEQTPAAEPTTLATPDVAEDTITPEAIAEAAARVFGGEAPPEAPAKVEEPVAEPEPPKLAVEDDKNAARVAAVKKAELRAAREREAIASAKAEVEREKLALAKEREEIERFRAAKRSPSKALEMLEMAPKDFLETLATENEPGSIAAREVLKEAEERKRLEAKLEALEASIAAEKQEAARAAAAESAKRTEQAFIESVEKAADKYPHLIEEFTPDETVREAYRVLSEVVRYDERGQPVTRNQAFKEDHGSEPTDDQIAEYLESLAKERAEIRAARRARMGQSAPKQPSQGVPEGDLKTAQPDRGQSPRTLTSRAATEKATAAKPWSQEAADEESLRILGAALKAG